MGIILDARKRKEEKEKKNSSSIGLAERAKLKRINLDTFNADLESTGTLISDAYSGWQKPEVMESTIASAQSMYNRAKDYQTYLGDNASEDVNNLVKAYETALVDLQYWQSVYGQYEAPYYFDKAKQEAGFAKQFSIELEDGTRKGLSYDAVQAEKAKYGVGTPEYQYLDHYLDYTDLDDFDKALENASGIYAEKLTAAKNKHALDNSFDRYDHYLDVDNFDERTMYTGSKLGEVSATNTLPADAYEWMNDFRGKTPEERLSLGRLNSLEHNGNGHALPEGVEYLTDDELNVYFVIANNNLKNGLKYLEDMEPTLTYRAQKASDESTQLWLEDGNAVERKIKQGGMSVLSIPESLVGNIMAFADDVGHLATGQDINPYNAAHAMRNHADAVRKTTSENIVEYTEENNWIGTDVPIIGNAWEFGYNTGLSIGESALGVATLGPAYKYVAGMSAFEGKAKELKEAGASDWQIVLGAGASGAFEMFFEEKSIENLIEIKNVDTLKRWFTETLKQGGIEMSEEMFTEMANVLADMAILGTESEQYKLYEDYINRGYSVHEARKQVAMSLGEQVLQAGIGGMFSGFTMGGAKGGIEHHTLSNTGKTIRGNNNVSDLRDLAADNYVYQKYVDLIDSGKIKNAQLGKLYGDVYGESATALDNEGKKLRANAVAEKATQLGYEGDVNALASAIENKLTGQKLTKAEKAILDTKEAKTILNEINSNTLEMKDTPSYAKAFNKMSRVERVLQEKSVDEKAIKERVEELNKGTVTEVTATGNSTKIESIKKDGDSTIVVTSEGEFNVEDMTFSKKDAHLVSYAEVMEQDKANLFLQQYDGKSDVEDYKISFDTAYKYGELGFNADTVLKHKGVLSESQASAIYTQAVKLNAERKQKAIDAINEKYSGRAFAEGSFNDSIIDYKGTSKDPNKVKWSELTTKQRRAISFAKAFAKVTGVNVRFIKSSVLDGEHKGKNGSYDASTNTIEIDVFAGRIDVNSTYDAIISTLSHEVTHWMKEKSPAIYSKMREHIAETLAMEGTSIDKRIQAEMNRLVEQHKEYADLSNEKLAELAIDELVARSCEDMLTNSKAARELLSQLTPKQQKSLIGKLQEVVQNIIDWADELLNEYKSTSEEAKILREHKDRLQELSEMWDAALTEAIKTNQSMKAGGVKVEGGGHIQHASRKYYTAYPLNKKYAKLDRGAKPTKEEWEVAGHAIFAEAVRREHAGERMDYDDTVTSSNHIFCYTHFADDSIVPQVYRVKRINNGVARRSKNVIRKTRTNNQNAGGQNSRQPYNRSGAIDGYSATTGNDVSLSEKLQGDNARRGDGRGEAHLIEHNGGRRDISNRGLKSDFQMESTVEETPELIAVHNMTVKELLRALSLGGLTMPSIAVLKAKQGYSKFGEISLIFRKETIDPKQHWNNKLYGADAWTPQQVQLKKNAKFDANETVAQVRKIRALIGKAYTAELFSYSTKEFKEKILAADGSIYHAFAYDIGMQTAYARRNFAIDKIPTKRGKLNMPVLKSQLETYFDSDAVWRKYKKWLERVSDSIITSYDSATSEDFFNNMRKQKETTKPFRLSMDGQLVVPATAYEGIDTLRKNKGRLSNDADAAVAEVAQDMLTFAKKLGKVKGISAQTVVDMINSTFEHRYSTAEIAKSFKENGISITQTMAESLQELYKKAVELPTQYFEAKPHRMVEFDEIATAIIPDNTDIEIKDALIENGISFTEYKAGDEQARLDALNKVPNVQFSDRDSTGRQLSDGQQKYFAQSKAVDENGNLMQVHHGTVREFYTFDREYANPEGDMGKGFYFTNDDHDVERNYANFEGADFTNKIEREADLLENEEEYQDMDHDEIVESLRAKYATAEEPITLDCYLNITNPVYVGDNETYLLADINENYDMDDFDSEEEYYDAVDQILYDTVDDVMYHINNNIDLWGDTSEIESILYESAQEGGITLAALKERLNNAYIEDENGNLVSNEVARLIVEALGYDGIIDTSVSNKFKNMELSHDTVHYIVFDSSQAKLITNENPTVNRDIRYSSRQIIGVSGTNYGMGVYLDDPFLSNLTDAERKELLKEYVVSELAGQHFIAYDKNKSAVDIQLAKRSDYFKNKNGKRKNVLEELYKKNNFLSVKQEAIVLIDELVANADYDYPQKSKYSHGWLDNYGKNDWDYWTVYIQEKNKAVWQARLNIANTTNGEKILYDIDPIKMVEGAAKSAQPTTNPTVQQNTPGSQVQNSDRNNTSVHDRLGQGEDLKKQNAKLEADIARLKERLKLERQVTNGNTFNAKQLGAVAGHLRNISKSTYDKAALVEELKDIYTYIVETPNLEWEELMVQCQALATKMLDNSKGEKVTNDYFKDVLADIRKARIKLNEGQIQEAKNAYGEKYRDAFMGRIMLTKDGVSLDQQWKEWSSMYPEIFDETISDADQITALSDIYDALREGAETYQKYNDIESVRALAVEIYNQYWNVSTITTTADKYDKQIKRLNFEHRKAMGELRSDFKEKMKNQETADAIHYGRIINDIRKKKDAEVRAAKEKGTQKLSSYKEAIEKKAKIQSITDKALVLAKWMNNPTNDKHIPEAMKPVVAHLLKSIDFSSKQLLGMRGGEHSGTPTQADISLAKALRDVRELMSDAKVDGEIIYELYGADLDEDIKKLVKDVDTYASAVGDNGYILNQMTLENLHYLDKLVGAIKTSVSQMNKFHIANSKKGVAYEGQRTFTYLDSLGQAKLHKDKTLSSVIQALEWGNATPYYAFKRFGPSGVLIYEALMGGWDKFSFNVNKIIKYAKDTYTEKEVKEWSKEVHSFDIVQLDGTSITVKMTTAQIMSLYCLQKREQAKVHINGGGIRVADFESGKEIISQSDGTALSDSDLKAILGTLTERQIEVADALQKFMNEVCSAWGNEISMARFGYKAFGEEYYFPIKSDENVTGEDVAKEIEKTLYRLLNLSFTKSTLPNADNRIVVDNIFDVFAQHTSEMAKYNALALPVLDAVRWFNYKERTPKVDGKHNTYSVKASMEKAFGKDAKGYVNTFLQDINGSENVSRDKLSGAFFTNAKIASVAFNARVIALQPTSYLRASALIDAKYLTKGMASKPKFDMAKKYCGIALWKSMGFYDTSIQRGVTELIKHDKTFKDKATEYGMKGAEKADEWTLGHLWNACELETRDKHPELQVGGEEFYQMVGKRLTQIIYATQVVDSTMTRSHMMRSSDKMDKMLTAFGSEPTLSYNMLQDCYFEWKLAERQTGSKTQAFHKHKGKMLRVFAAYTTTNIVASLIETAFEAWRDNDDEEEEFIDYLKMYLANFGSNQGISTKIPYLKDIISGIQGFTSSRTDTQWIQNMTYGVKEVFKLFNGKGSAYKAVYRLTQVFSQMSGVAVSNIVREVASMWNNTFGWAFPSFKFK